MISAVSEDPEFTDIIENITVAQGRNVKFGCSVKNLGSYKVSPVDNMSSLTKITLFRSSNRLETSKYHFTFLSINSITIRAIYFPFKYQCCIDQKSRTSNKKKIPIMFGGACNLPSPLWIRMWIKHKKNDSPKI